MAVVNVCGTGLDAALTTKIDQAAGLDNSGGVPGDSGYDLARNISPATLDADAGNPVVGSRGGIQVPWGTSDHNNNSEVFVTRANDIITYWMWVHPTVNPTFAFSAFSGAALRSTYEPYTSATNGAATLISVPISATTFRFDLYIRDAGAWGLKSSAGAAITEGSHICVGLQIDLANGGGTPRARVLLGTGSGAGYSVATYIDWQESAALAGAGCMGTPSVGGHQTGAGSNGVTARISDVMKSENSTEAIVDWPDEVHTCYAYPRTTGTNGVGNWAEGGDASCNGDPAKQIDDAEDDDDGAFDYIITPDATTTDCWFLLAGDVDASATIYGVGAVDVSGASNLASHHHVKDNGNTLRVAVNGAGATDQLGYTTFATEPDAGAWTPAGLNAYEFGARASLSGARIYSYGVWIVGHSVFGAHTYRGSKAQPCTAAGFVPRVVMIG